MSRRVGLLVVLVVLALLAGGAGWYLGPVAPIATGYAAKTVCSGVFVAGRTADDVARDLPDNPLVPFLQTEVDASAQAVTTRLLGLYPSRAWFTPGLGCTLAEQRPGFTALDPLPAPGPGPWPAGAGAPTTPPGVDPQGLKAALDGAFVEDDRDGRRRNTRAVVVVKSGTLVAERYGDGVGPQTPLLGWSMTKSVASAMVGRLVHQGIIDLDAAGLRPEWENDGRADITLRHLLTMTDGLAFEEVYDPDTDATRMLYRPADMGGYAAAKPLTAPPGTTFAYSSGSTNLLCEQAHEASGLGPEMARELVFAPLGMASAVLEPDASGELACSAFLYATARDWARFGQWYLQDGVWDGQRLLPEGWVAASSTPVAASSGGSAYGLGWWLNADAQGVRRMPSVPADAFWASGHEGQQVVVIPSEELVVVRLGLSGDFDGIEWGLEPLLAGIIAATR